MPASVLGEREALTGTSGGGGAPPNLDLRGEEGPPGFLADPARVGLLAFMGTVSMLFIGFTSAYILRRASSDWAPLAPPWLLFVNTAVLLTSSLAVEGARRSFRSLDMRRTSLWISATGVLGAAFLLGQVGAWRQLAAKGVFLASNPHSSFFYVLTGAHAVHLLGGLAWFLVLARRTHRMALSPGGDDLALFATYWHFLAGLWLYLVFLLFVL